MGSRMGAHAVNCLLEGKKNRIVALRDNKLVDIDLFEALSMSKTMDKELINLSKILAM
jgi:6-phosphofructokinase 1